MNPRRQRIFAADIGGTNARFALFLQQGDGLRLQTVQWACTAHLKDTADLLQTMRACLGTGPGPGDALSVALAGPIDGLTGKLTNAPLTIDLRETATQLELAQCCLLNDFAAQAFATLTEPGRKARLIRAGASNASPRATRAVIGGGTGLGAASLFWDKAAGHWLPIPSEAGHAPFAFVGHDEWQLQKFLAQELGHECPEAEEVLSGRGLSLLHRFLTGRVLPPAEVAAEAFSRDTPTLRLYARFLGRFCCQWCCTTLCFGGLWIAGGVAARNPRLTACPDLLADLTRLPVWSKIVEHVPLWVMDDNDSGLWGAALAAMPFSPTDSASCAVS